MSALVYQSEWLLPITSPPIRNGVIAVENGKIIFVGTRETADLEPRLRESKIRNFGCAALLPGFVNVHTHLELTVMRGLLEGFSFPDWILKLTAARRDHLSADDLSASALLGTVEAIRAGITTIADTGDSSAPFDALRQSGMRGIAYREVFGPDPRDAASNLNKLKQKVEEMRMNETDLVHVGISPHSPYTVSQELFRLAAEFAAVESFDVCVHAAESQSEELLIRSGAGEFARGIAERGIGWHAPGTSTMSYLDGLGILATRPLLVHCVNATASDIELLATRNARVAHCPKSNAKLGHGVAPFKTMIDAAVKVGLGTDGVVSNNRCDMIDEARFCALVHRAASKDFGHPTPKEMLKLATLDGARALGMDDITGSLEVGKSADLTVIDLSRPHHSAVGDPETTIVFSASAEDVVFNAVEGRVLFEEGKLNALDEGEVLMRARAASGRLAR